MKITRECKGLYTITCNGREWSVTDTGSLQGHGAWRWNVTEYYQTTGGYCCGTYKQAKEIIAKYSNNQGA